MRIKKFNENSSIESGFQASDSPQINFSDFAELCRRVGFLQSQMDEAFRTGTEEEQREYENEYNDLRIRQLNFQTEMSKFYSEKLGVRYFGK